MRAISNAKFLEILYNDICGNTLSKIIVSIYLTVTVGTISYGTYCMTLHKTEYSCPIVFATGILLILFILVNLIGIVLSCCFEEEQQRITRNPMRV
jgi:hypothetical protein